MTGKIASAVTGKVVDRINGPSGVNSAMPSSFSAAQVRAQNVSPDVADRSTTVQYPALNVYCEKISNTLTEKFRTFSGSVQMAVEVRLSQDRLDSLQDNLELIAGAVMQVLHQSRGDWGDGMFYGGEYQVSFGAVKHGGRNFLQTAKITFEIGVSKN